MENNTSSQTNGPASPNSAHTSRIARRDFLRAAITGLALACNLRHCLAQTAPVDDQAKASALCDNGLNPEYTFDSFVVGSSNEFAYVAALAVARQPGTTYDPLFIYGGAGLGKTHLLHAIGNHVASSRQSNILYLTGECFWNEFIDAIRNNTLAQFRKRFCAPDVLLVDDIQFFSGNGRSQEEFLHTFNNLFDGHKQIVLAAGGPASQLANLDERLARRFEWGLTAELQYPGIETRLAILWKNEESVGIRLPPRTLEFLAQRIRTNVRRLVGAWMRVASFTSLNGRKLSTETVAYLIQDILREEAKQSSLSIIQRGVVA